MAFIVILVAIVPLFLGAALRVLHSTRIYGPPPSAPTQRPSPSWRTRHRGDTLDSRSYPFPTWRRSVRTGQNLVAYGHSNAPQAVAAHRIERPRTRVVNLHFDSCSIGTGGLLGCAVVALVALSRAISDTGFNRAWRAGCRILRLEHRSRTRHQRRWEELALVLCGDQSLAFCS
jgi:hypothetical protein